MIYRNEVAKGVRVRLNKNWRPETPSEIELEKEPVLFIVSPLVTTIFGEDTISVMSGSFLYYTQIQLRHLVMEYPTPTKPLYSPKEDMKKVEIALLLQERDIIEKRINDLNENAIINHDLKNIYDDMTLH